MRKGHLILPLLILSLTLSGCASFSGYPKRATNTKEALDSVSKYLEPGIIKKYDEETDVAIKQLLRNEIVNARIYATDLYFAAYQQELHRENIGLNIATDWTIFGLAGAGSVVGGAGTSAAINAAIAGVKGAKESFSDNAFYKKTMTVILSEMVALRKTVLARIRGNLDLSVTEYPLYHALVDLEDYYNAGTIVGALMGITEESGATAKEAEEELKRILIAKRPKSFVAPASIDRVERIIRKINELTNDEAIAMNNNLPSLKDKDDVGEKAVKDADPKGKRFVEGDAAKKALEIRARENDRTEQNFAAWENALVLSGN